MAERGDGVPRLLGFAPAVALSQGTVLFARQYEYYNSELDVSTSRVFCGLVATSSRWNGQMRRAGRLGGARCVGCVCVSLRLVCFDSSQTDMVHRTPSPVVAQ